ncbi:MFS transporter [Nocardia sp. CDC160]|uniref:MFS transporter n=1 Tax=Nocardia sp. CDC160 TaxID=3112166 RepID=UPI002DB89485|nr:MFS transporter [Nocardia sp. CDC160]MEC3917322.1 MFS transporter [Nocardia sp. CDC160]
MTDITHPPAPPDPTPPTDDHRPEIHESDSAASHSATTTPSTTAAAHRNAPPGSTVADTTAGSARLALLVASGAAFMSFLDLSVVNIAFPAITRDYPGTAATTLTWVVSGYAVAFAALLTPAGQLADALGRGRVFLTALGGFALTSLLCALAPGADWLIAGRFLQGATAAFLIPAGLGLVLSVTAPERLGVAMAAWTAAGGFAATVGPAVGGALVDWFGWRSVFVINVPIAALLILAGLRLARGDRRHSHGLPDLLGTLATGLGIGLVVAAVTQGQQWDWTDPRTLGCGLGGLVLLALALWRSRAHPRPAIAVGLWRSHSYALVNAVAFVFGATMFAWLLAGPLWLDGMWHYSVLQSAAAMTVGAIASMVTAVLARRAPAAWQRWLGVLGALMFAASAFYMSTDVWDATPALWKAWVPAGILGGGGIGLLITVLGTTAARSLPPQRFAAGVGMNLTARQSGGALGVAVLAAVFAAEKTAPLTAFHTLFAVCGGIAVVAAVLAALPVKETTA